MKLNLINSLLLDSSNFLVYINSQEDLEIIKAFINMLIDMKRNLIK